MCVYILPLFLLYFSILFSVCIKLDYELFYMERDLPPIGRNYLISAVVDFLFLMIS